MKWVHAPIKMFRGRYQHTIDPKGRLSVPARFRDALAQYGENLVVVPNEYSLEVHPLEEWQRFEEKLNGQSMFSPEVRKVSRLYISRAKDIALDGAGRILLPPDTRAQAGLEKDVTILGGGRKMFEVWDRARFDEYERTQGDALPTLFEKLSALGV
jgi:transcriptional regulator MraZ